jgi:hypothetical protein
MADTAPGQVIRWHSLGSFYVVAAQGTMQLCTMPVCAMRVGTMRALTIIIMARFVSGL